MPTIEQPQKLTIYSLEGPSISVTAMFNPAEIQVDKSVPWTKQSTSRSDIPSLEFHSADGRVMSFELLFDGYGAGTNVHTLYIEPLTRLALVQDPNGAEDKKRPPKVGVKWMGNKMPEFHGVIESISTRYTMVLPDGTPVRASCRIAVREANRLSVSVNPKAIPTGIPSRTPQ
jgi:hypothetical protein